MVCFFGTGLLGSGFVRAMLRRGERVNVWNRSADKARALEAAGAKAFDDPALAARGAERVHLALSDDAAVDDVLTRAEASLTSDVTIVDHTTTSAHGTRARVARWDAAGIAFVHAPVFMGPQNALESTGLMLVSGARERVAHVTPALRLMTGKVIDFGDRPDEAAAMKLLGNMFLMFLTSGLAEVFALGRAFELEPRAVAALFAHFNPGAALGPRIDRMLGGTFDKTSWSLAMARKDARLMQEEAEREDMPLHVLPAIGAWMDALVARGHGADDWTVLAKDAVSGAAPKSSR